MDIMDLLGTVKVLQMLELGIQTSIILKSFKN